MDTLGQRHSTRYGRVVEHLWNDLRYVFRSLIRTPQFTIAVIVLLGMGIGAATTMFSIVSKYRFRPLPVRDGGSLVALAARRPARTNLTNLSYPNYKDIRDGNTAFDGLIAYNPIQPRVKSDSYSGRPWGQVVTGNYFEMLGIMSSLGRVLTPADDAEAAEAVAVISHYLWQDSFNSDPKVIGTRIYLNGYPFIIAGVIADGFRGTDSLLRADLWVTAAKSQYAGGPGLENRTGNAWRTLGRLRPGTTLNQAQSNLDALSARLGEQFPTENRGLQTRAMWEKHARPEVSSSNAAPVLWMLLMGMAGAVLGIAGANVTSLMLARAISRQREISVRLALGATRARLISQLLMESLFVSIAGGLIGFAVAARIMNFFSSVETPSNTPIYFDYVPDNIVFAFTMMLAILTAVLVGTAPALTATRSNLQTWLKDGYGTTMGRRRSRLQSFVVTSQFAAVTLLLVLASLFLQRIQDIQKIDTGFASENRLLLTVSTADNGYTEDRGRKLISDLVARVRALPGVKSADVANDVPLASGSSSMEIQPVGEASIIQPTQVSYNVVGSGYLALMEIPLAVGRAFDERDRTGTTPVAIINETMAARFWPGVNPIGKRILTPIEGDRDRAVEVIGVAKNARYYSINEAPMNFFYLPYSQVYRQEMTLLVHTDRDPTLLTVSVRDALRQLDPSLSLFNVLTLEEGIDNMQLGGARIAAALLGGFGLQGFLLATLGLYGLLSYFVRLQVRDISIRMALGASARRIVGLFVGRGLKLAVFGLAAGMLAAQALASVIGSFIIGAWTLNVVTLVEIAGLIAAVAVMASWLPARRTVAGNPMDVLRHEQL